MERTLLRAPREDELEIVAALHRRSREAALPFMRGLHTVEEDLTFFRERVFPQCEVRVAERAGEIVGMAAVRGDVLEHLYVDPAYQRNGIGTMLLCEVLRGRRELNLWTFQVNAPARAFYEKHGFTVVRMTDGRDNEERQPDVLYRWCRVSDA